MARWVKNSEGETYNKIQQAINGLTGAGWVEISEGLFREPVVITNSSIELRGHGPNTIIHGNIGTGAGAVSGHAIRVSGANCYIHDLTVMTSGGQGLTLHGIVAQGSGTRIERVSVASSDDIGIALQGAYCWVSECGMGNIDGDGIEISALHCHVVNNIITNAGVGVDVTATGDQAMIANNHIESITNDGVSINLNAEYCVVDANKIFDFGAEPVDDDSATSIVSDNDCGGPVMNSKGCAFSTVQGAIDHLGLTDGGWVEVPSQTFAESLRISGDDITLYGATRNRSRISPTAGHGIIITGDHCNVYNLRVNATTTSGVGILISGGDTNIFGVAISAAPLYGIWCHNTYNRIEMCNITTTASVRGIYCSSSEQIIQSNLILGVAANNISGGIEFAAGSVDNLAVGNRIENYSNKAIIDAAAANNLWSGLNRV